MACENNSSLLLDDFDETKNFHRILYNPGRAVQARELTQQQTILQEQIKRVGTHLFDEGSMIIPGDISYDQDVPFVRVNKNSGVGLKTVEELETFWLNKTIEGVSSKVKALVVAIQEADINDNVTLFLKYISGSPDGKQKEFLEGEEIQDVNLNTTDAVINISSPGQPAAKGRGTAASIREGVYFIRGFFVKVYTQRIILDAESLTPTASVGLLINQKVVTSDDDPSLLDNSTGSPNFAAPGADRLKISLTLVKKDINEVTDDNYIELLRIINGNVIKKIDRTSFNIIGDELASRTFDESGNYTVDPFIATVQEHPTDNNKFQLLLDPGKAFIRGYEVKTLSKTIIDLEKAQTTETKNNISINAEFGNYVQANNLHGNPFIREFAICELTDTPTLVPGVKSGTTVGTARIRAIRFKSGDANSPSAIYKIFLFDIKLNAGKSFRDVRQIYQQVPSTLSGLDNFTADTVINEFLLNGAAVKLEVGSAPIGDLLTGDAFTTWLSVDGQRLKAGDIIRIEAPITGEVGHYQLNSDPISDNQLDVSPFVGDFLTGTLIGPGFDANTGTLPNDIPHSVTLLFSIGVEDAQNNILLFPLPNERIATIRDANDNIDTSFTVASFFSTQGGEGNISVVNGSVDLSLSSSGKEFNSNDPNDYIVYNYTLNKLVEISDVNNGIGSGPVTLISSIPGDLNISDEVSVIAPVRKFAPSGTESAPKEKSKVLTKKVLTVLASESKNNISLQHADIFRIVSIIDDTTSKDITDDYILDNGQRDNFYDIGRLQLKTGKSEATGNITITYEYFKHQGSGDYFSVDSYLNGLDTSGNPFKYEDIPFYRSSNLGEIFFLADVLDYRPRVNDQLTSSTPPDFISAGSSRNDLPIDRITADYKFFLPRIDKLYIDTSGKFNLIQGNPSVVPQPPEDPQNGMVLYDIGLKANSIDITDVILSYKENKRYTMRDIGDLEKRIDTLEFYTELSLLEKETADLKILDSQGLDRFKLGFIVDPFNGHDLGDTLNEDYKVSIDMNFGQARPPFNEDNVSLELNSLNNVVNKNGLLMLPFTHELSISQDIATSAINVNPFNIFSFIGVAKLNPESDQWKETKVLQPVIKTDSTAFDTIKTQVESQGTIWGEWNQHWSGEPSSKTEKEISRTVQRVKSQTKANQLSKKFGLPITTTATGHGRQLRTIVKEITQTFNGTRTRSGFKLRAVPQIIRKDLGTKVVNVAYIPYMRNIQIQFEGKGLKPLTKVNAFFDEVNINEFVSYSGPDPEGTSFVYPNIFLDNFKVSNAGDTWELGTVTATLDNSSVKRASVTLSDIDNSKMLGVKGVDQTNKSTFVILSSSNVGNVFTFQFAYNNKVGSGINVGDILSLAIGKGLAGFVVSTVQHESKTIPSLLPNEKGEITGVFNVPNNAQNKFLTGVRKFTLIDSDVGPLDPNWSSRAETNFFAQGILETKQKTILSTKVAKIVREEVFETENISRTVTNTVVKRKWVDPIAQSFLVTDPGGMFISKIHLYFRTKDPNVPVSVELRNMEVGLPSSLVIPGSQVIIDSDKVVTNRVIFDSNNEPIDLLIDLADGNGEQSINDILGTSITPEQYNDNFKETVVEFESPVYVSEGSEIAIVIMANSDKYEVWRAKAALTDPEPKIGTNIPISENPYAGSMFKSQNSSTWTPEQESDLRFQIYKANFSPTNGTATFVNTTLPFDQLQTNPFKTTAGKTLVRVHHPNHGLFENAHVLISGVSEDVNGIPLSELNGEFQVTNVDLDSYTIDTSSGGISGTPATSTGFGGGSNVLASKNVPYEVLKLIANTIEVPKTKIVWSIQTTSSKSPFDVGFNQANLLSSPFNVSVNEDINFLSPQMIASELQEKNELSGQKSLQVTATLFTELPNLSPVIDLQRLSAITISNRLDYPSFDNHGNSKRIIVDDIDRVNLLTNSTVEFSKDTSRPVIRQSDLETIYPHGFIRSTNVTDAIKLNQIPLGSIIDVSINSPTVTETIGSVIHDNNGEYVVLSKEHDGSTTILGVTKSDDLSDSIANPSNPSFDTESSNVTIDFFENFIDERSPTSGASGSARYITKRFVLSEQATGLRISFAASVQERTELEVYYRIQDNDSVPFNSLPYRRATLDEPVPKSENEDDLREYVYTENDLPPFTAVAVKVVMRGTDPTTPPTIQDFRAIALGT